MCTVWILTTFGFRAVDPVALQPKARMEQAWGKPEVERPKKAVVKKPFAASKSALTPAPLQIGGDLEKTIFSAQWSKKDSAGHYSQRCGEHNHREQVCRKTARRHQVVRY